MADGAQVSPRRYSAFISYTHRDVAAAKRLQHQLETYKLPARVAVATPEGRLRGRRLKPIFRDISDLSAEHDLSAAIREALARSDNLIVVCSPRSAQSEWVGREIDYFRALHGDTGIRAAVVDGSTSEALHPALRNTRDGARIEPLAANFTKAGPGRKLAMLKLVAGLAGVELDELVQRDAQRQVRRVGVGAVGATASMSILAGLTFQAVNARNDAATQRDKAQSLVGFAVNDLGRDLRHAGRLDLLENANAQALSYFEGQDLASLSDAAQDQRAKLLQSAGQNDLTRGEYSRATPRLNEAWRITYTQFNSHPEDPKWIFAHAQSEYWISLLKLRTQDIEGATLGFERYAALARQLTAKDPTNFEWRHEVAYGDLNLGMVALRQKGDPVTAERHFVAALKVVSELSAQRPGDIDLRRGLADATAWLADSQRVRGDLKNAWSSRLAERRIIDRLIEENPRNVEVRIDAFGSDLALARIEVAKGETAKAAARLQRSHDTAIDLSRSYPENGELAEQTRILALFRIRTLLDSSPHQRSEIAKLAEPLQDCRPKDDRSDEAELSDFCLVMAARVAALGGDRSAISIAKMRLQDSLKTGVYSPRWGINLSEELLDPREDAHTRVR